MILMVEISPGELFDKITILEIKAERIRDKGKLVHITKELSILKAVIEDNMQENDVLNKLKKRLKKINEKLWVIEDEIRICEKNKDFGDEFIELARSVYITNDKRAAVKQEINELLSANIQEVKSYEQYS